MRPPSRTPTAIVIAFLAAPAFVGAQYDLPCPTGTVGQATWPSPRWLAVTVVDTFLEDPVTAEISRVRLQSLPIGQTILDRCDIRTIGSGLHAGSGALIELIRSRADEPFRMLAVAESPKAICAALHDCAAPLLPGDDPESPVKRP